MTVISRVLIAMVMAFTGLFARLISSTGDSVTTYGEPWTMN
jgi:hypothetical protein